MALLRQSLHAQDMAVSEQGLACRGTRLHERGGDDGAQEGRQRGHAIDEEQRKAKEQDVGAERKGQCQQDDGADNDWVPAHDCAK